MPKLAARLTDIQIKNTKPKEKPFRVAAGRGLFLLVKPDASKHWVFRYQFEGKENNLSFGRYPEISLANAEKKATNTHELLAGGIKP